VTWGKIASWGVAAAMTAGFGLAVSQAQAAVHAAVAGPPAGYAPIRTGQGMCLDDKGGVGRDGQPVQLWKCLGNRNEAWRAEPDGTIRNANGYCLGTGTAANGYAATADGARLVMVDCARSYLGSYWTISPFARQIVNKHAAAALDNRQDAQRDGNPVQLCVHHDGHHDRLAGVRDRHPGARPRRADHGVVRPAGELGPIWYTSN
jgi:Ricin-type beta-trefoil lectin domain